MVWKKIYLLTKHELDGIRVLNRIFILRILNIKILFNRLNSFCNDLTKKLNNIILMKKSKKSKKKNITELWMFNFEIRLR